MERGVEKPTGSVAGKGPPRAIAAVRARRESDDHRAGAGVAEGGDGFAPIRAIAMSPFAFTGDLRGVRPQFRTASAADDGGFDRRKRPHGDCNTSAYSMPIGATTYATPSLRCHKFSTAARG